MSNTRLEPAEVVAMIKERTGVTFTTKRIFNLARSNQFPEPRTYINAKTIFWDRDDIGAWIEQHFPDGPKQAKRDPAAPNVKVARRGAARG